MTEITNTVLARKPESRRCLACRLPDELRREIERDRLRSWKTFEELARDVAARGFSISTSSLRRHFGEHVDPTAYFVAVKANDSDAEHESVPTAFDDLVGSPLDEGRLLEATVDALVAKLQHAEREYAVAHRRGGPAADRALTRFLNIERALERCLARLDERRTTVEKLRGQLPSIAAVFARLAVVPLDAGLSDYQEDFMYEVEHPYYEDEIDGDEREAREERLRAKWGMEIGQRISRAIHDRCSGMAPSAARAECQASGARYADTPGHRGSTMLPSSAHPTISRRPCGTRAAT